MSRVSFQVKEINTGSQLNSPFPTFCFIYWNLPLSPDHWGSGTSYKFNYIFKLYSIIRYFNPNTPKLSGLKGQSFIML